MNDYTYFRVRDTYCEQVSWGELRLSRGTIYKVTGHDQALTLNHAKAYPDVLEILSNVALLASGKVNEVIEI